MKGGAMTMRKFKSGLFGYSKKSVERVVSTLASRHEQRKSELHALIGELSSGRVQSMQSIPAADESEKTRLVLRPRASLWGYRKGAVNHYIRNFHKYCDQELSELCQRVESLQIMAVEKVSQSELEVAVSVTEAATVAPVVVEEKSPIEVLLPVVEQSSVGVLSSVETMAIVEELLPTEGMPIAKELPLEQLPVKDLPIEELSSAQQSEQPLVEALPTNVQSLVEEAPLAEQSLSLEETLPNEAPQPLVEEPLAMEELSYYEAEPQEQLQVATPVQPAADARRASNVVQFRRKSPASVEAPELQPSQPSQKSQQSQELIEQSVGYWGEIQRYLATPSAGLEASEPIASEPILGATSLASASSMSETVPAYFDYHLPEPAIRRSAPDRSPQRQPISRTPLKEPAKDKLKTEEPAQQPHTVQTAQPASTLSAAPPAPQSPAISSRGITEEVAQLRYKYILGKMTGKDLHTRQGRLIAAKNTPITRAVIDDADREGMLAELIIHMTIPGIEVDEP
jgi:hypothetical protein